MPIVYGIISTESSLSMLYRLTPTQPHATHAQTHSSQHVFDNYTCAAAQTNATQALRFFALALNHEWAAMVMVLDQWFSRNAHRKLHVFTSKQLMILIMLSTWNAWIYYNCIFLSSELVLLSSFFCWSYDAMNNRWICTFYLLLSESVPNRRWWM